MGQEPDALGHDMPDDMSVPPALARRDDNPDAGNSDTSDLDGIHGDIEQTRSQMSETIDAIQERLSPQHLVAEAKASVRDATIGRVEHMVDSARTSAQQAGGGFVDTIRENPVPVALIGIGLGWLFMRGRNRPRPYPQTAYGRAYPYAYPSQQPNGYGYSQQPGQYHQADRLRDKTGQLAGQAQDKLQDLGNQVQDKVQQFGGQAQDTLQQFGDQAQDQMLQARNWFEDMLHENPLALGVVALALGGLVGLAIPETPQEHQLMGDTRDSLVGKARDAAQDTLQKAQSVAQEAVDAAKQEAQRQGLTGTGTAGTITNAPQPRPGTQGH
jgi:ElaB/YqjD/DUF883 family membrane-anchored ribosome-binding protein